MKAFVLASNMPQPIKNYWMQERPIEFRPVSLKHYLSRDPLPPDPNSINPVVFAYVVVVSP